MSKLYDRHLHCQLKYGNKEALVRATWYFYLVDAYNGDMQLQSSRSSARLAQKQPGFADFVQKVKEYNT